MKIGRNDPCPCGSGRKYKRCCLPLEDQAGLRGSGLGAVLRDAASRADRWEVDMVPLPAVFDDDPEARPCGLLVVAEGFVIHNDVLRRPSAEPDEAAAELARHVVTAGGALDARPSRLAVRHAEVVEALTRRLDEHGWKVEVEVGELDGLEEASEAFRSRMTGERAGQAVASAPTWASWGLPEASCAGLFRGAAAFHRAAPWERLFDSDVLELDAPSGELWWASVLGAGGQEFGLVLYTDPGDPEGLLRPDGPDGEHRFRGAVLYLSFEPGSGIPRPMRKEVARAGWEVASAEAYPWLIAINTLAGGVSRERAGDLAAALRAVAGFVGVHAEAVEAGEAVSFVHEPTGVTIRFPSVCVAAPRPGLRADLEPGGPEGPGARPEAALERGGPLEDPEAPESLPQAERELLERFTAALEAKGLGASTVETHVDNAGLFLEFLSQWNGVPVAAVHEYDLRIFLYDWFPRKVATSRTRAMRLPASLRRLVAHLAEAEGIRLPWAEGLLLDDREVFEERWESAPGGAWWDDEIVDWRSELWMDLGTRLLVHDQGLGDSGHWGATQGMTEARLSEELQRRWLLWRDELLREGAGADPARLRQRLVERQRRWETTPHAGFDDRTPVEAILEERRRREEIPSRRRDPTS